ncbi:DUF1697 domain-containing protein [Streptomyces odontomachi]|uniref:DUF1697 domain-containing protein n=1 Tax=Streptomyces odontomachi TaxID=2944940 RepID=UPI00210A6252|nr:DUF1697 domain-containing protein [Streptomyces sp. ODS25]
MTTHYAALLRGINVGGKRVPMAELRTLMEGLGLDAVRTHLQSGNAVFTSDEDDEEKLAAHLEQALEKHFGFPVACLVRDGAYLKAVADACPFPAATLTGKQLHATYFSTPVDQARFAHLDQPAFLPEEFRLGDRVLYLYVPDGLGRSRLAEALSRPAVTRGLVATSRNWNTVTKLVELTHE